MILQPDKTGAIFLIRGSNLKKIIEVTREPNGWEYWEFPACFATVYMQIGGLTAGRQSVITLYGVASGISHVQLDMTDREHFPPGFRFNENGVIGEYDDYIGFTMGFAGYTCERYDKSNERAAVSAAIKKSIDAGRPVLMNFGKYYSWCAIVGYDEEAGTLYGLDDVENYWKDRTGECDNGMFVTGDWYEYMAEAVVVTGRTAPSVTYDDVFRRMAGIMEAMERKGYGRHSIDYLRDAANFEGYDGESYLELAGRVASLVALLIDQRSWLSNFFKDLANADAFKDKARYLKQIAALYGGSADVCWLAWHMVGSFPERPELDAENCAKLLPSPIYRNAIAEAVEVILGNDRRVLDCLKEMMGNTTGE